MGDPMATFPGPGFRVLLRAVHVASPVDHLFRLYAADVTGQ